MPLAPQVTVSEDCTDADGELIPGRQLKLPVESEWPTKRL